MRLWTNMLVSQTLACTPHRLSKHYNYPYKYMHSATPYLTATVGDSVRNRSYQLQVKPSQVGILIVYRTCSCI